MYRMPHRTESRWFRLRRCGGWVLVLLASLCARPALGNDDLPSEYRIKAAYLYNLIKFVTWPGESTLNSSDPLILCVYGYNPFGSHLERLESRRVRNHPLDVRYIGERQSAASCNLLFISRYNATLPPELEPRKPASKKQAAANPPDTTPPPAPLPLLTVSDDADFLSHGGLIALVDAGNSIHLDINLTRARELGLQFSANLLEIARRLE